MTDLILIKCAEGAIKAFNPPTLNTFKYILTLNTTTILLNRQPELIDMTAGYMKVRITRGTTMYATKTNTYMRVPHDTVLPVYIQQL